MNEASITFKLKAEEKEQLKQIALEKDMSISQVVRQLIREALKNQ